MHPTPEDAVAPYSHLQVPGMPGVYFREMKLELVGRELSIYSASAVDLLERARGETNPYWCVAWPAGLALAEHVVALDLRGVSALELGCGVGATALAAALAGAEVLATDSVPSALRITAMNARRNGLELEILPGDWRRWPLVRRFDLILAADVTYSLELLPHLLAVMSASLNPKGEVWLADPCRDSTDHFLKLARQAGWQATSSRLREDDRLPVRLTRLSREDRQAGLGKLA